MRIRPWTLAWFMPTSRMVSSMPGIDFSAPERTETNSGARGSPNRCSVAASKPADSCGHASAQGFGRRFVAGDDARAEARRQHESRRHVQAKPDHPRQFRRFRSDMRRRRRARRTALTDEDRFVIPGDHAESPCNMRSRSDIAAWASRSVVSSSARAISRPRTEVRASPSSARRGSRPPSLARRFRSHDCADRGSLRRVGLALARDHRIDALQRKVSVNALAVGNQRWRLQSRSPDEPRSPSRSGQLGKRRAEPVGAIVLRRKTDQKCGLIEGNRSRSRPDRPTAAMRSRCEFGRTISRAPMVSRSPFPSICLARCAKDSAFGRAHQPAGLEALSRPCPRASS